MVDPAATARKEAPSAHWQGFLLLILLIALFPAAKAVLHDTLDPDSFIHLLAADQMSREGIGPIVDSQSYMSIREAWTPYSWLAEFGMKFIWEQGGHRAAVASHALMAAALMCLYGLSCLARIRQTAVATQGQFVRAIVATAFAAFFTIPYLSFRPATAALVIMAVCVWLLVRDRSGGERTRAVWLVIPLTALLINVHLYAIIVPAWLGALWAGGLWELWRAPPQERPESRRRVLRYAGLMTGAGLACLATPMLPGAVRSIVFYQFGDAIVAGSVVREYLPFHHGTSGTISVILLLVVLACAIARRRELRAGEMFWLLGSVVLLLRMGRFAPIFAMVAVPIFAATMPRLSDRVLARPAIRVCAAAIAALVLFQIAVEFSRPGISLDAWVERYDPTLPGYPANAAAFVENNVTARTGRLINEYTWGGYLSWRLGPRFKVLLDGRTNLYRPEFWRLIYFAGEEERAEFLGSIDADAAILPVDNSRFEKALVGNGWTRKYSDGRAAVFMPPAVDEDQSSISRLMSNAGAE